jgi:hypothetical protein
MPQLTYQKMLELPNTVQCLEFRFNGSSKCFQSLDDVLSSPPFDFSAHFPSLSSLTLVDDSVYVDDSFVWRGSFVANHAPYFPCSLTHLNISLGPGYEDDDMANLPIALHSITLGAATSVSWLHLTRLPHLHTLKLPMCSKWILPSSALGQPLESLTSLDLPRFEEFVLSDPDAEEAPFEIILSLVPNLTKLSCPPHSPQVLRFQHLEDLNLIFEGAMMGIPAQSFDNSSFYRPELKVLRMGSLRLNMAMKDLLLGLGPNIEHLELPRSGYLLVQEFAMLPKRLKSLKARWYDPPASVDFQLPSSLISLTQETERFRGAGLSSRMPGHTTINSLPRTVKYFRLNFDDFFLSHSAVIEPAGYDLKGFPGLFHSGFSNITQAIESDDPELFAACFHLSPVPFSPSQFQKLVTLVIHSDSIEILIYMDRSEMLPKKYCSEKPWCKKQQPQQQDQQEQQLQQLANSGNSLDAINSWNTPVRPAGASPWGYNVDMDVHLTNALSCLPTRILEYLIGTRGFWFAPNRPNGDVCYPIHVAAKAGKTDALETLWQLGFKDLDWASPWTDRHRRTTPLDLALSANQFPAIMWLYSHGAAALEDWRLFPPPSIGLGTITSFLDSLRPKGATQEDLDVILEILKLNKLVV